MGFVQKKEDDGGGALGGGAGLEVDLDLKACETCRRELLPWQDTCPDDGGRALPKTALAPDADPLLARLLDEPDDEAPAAD
jgi:hypothetical protein